MITHKTGDIFTTELEAIGHGVNIEGVMGSGIAVTVRTLHPNVYEEYREYCEKGLLTGGDLLVVQSKTDGKYIFNMASQEKKGRNATYDFLRQSTRRALTYCVEYDMPALALPQIGCGIGGLEWSRVTEILEEESERFPEVDLELWTYPDLPKNYWKLPYKK